MQFSRIAAALGLVLALAVSAVAEKMTAEEQLTRLGEDYLALAFDFDPVFATQMGDHRFDTGYPNFTSGAVNKMVTGLRGLKTKLKKINQSQLSTDAKIDYLLLESNLDTQILLLSNTALYRDNPKLYSEAAINGIYFIMTSQSLPEDERLRLILARLADLPDFLSSVQRQLKNPPQVWVLLAKDEANSAVTFLGELAAYYSARFPDKQKEIDTRFAGASSALQDFADVLSDFAERDGQSFAIGRDTFNRLLKTQYFIDYDVDTLLAIGDSLFEQAQGLYDSLAAVVETLPPIEEMNIFVPATFSRDDILDYFQWEINQTRRWVETHDFATVPADIGDCIPIETPAFLDNIIGGIAYEPPGPFETVQLGRFYVRPLPDSLDEANRSAFFRYCYRRGFRSSVVHEAYPGHHMMIQLANRNTSLIRRIQRNNLFVEGWALYCEEAMYDAGFYGNDPRTLLAIVGGIRFRAGRIILDVKLHTGQMTYQQAVDWMVEKLGASLEYAEKEVNRYTLTPTQPMSYLIGKEQIKQARAAFKQRMGDLYSIKRFHDAMLNEGAIPPSLILRKINEQIL
ncbi:MAG: DUF885 domain-containing protein [candidate division Zixibacteria bacterium]|nr:DUF885 domain-containing protein [candidate division Zixibacteria bacterium]